MNKSAETCDSLPPSLTDPESEPDSEFEPESEQEYAIEKIGIKYQIDSPPNLTINASEDGIESEKVNHEDAGGLTIMTWNKDENAVNYDLVSSNDSREMSGNSKRMQSGINQAFGMALSENRSKKNIETITNLSLGKHTSSEVKFGTQKPYKLPGTACATEVARMDSPNIHVNKSVGTYCSLPPSLTNPESEPGSKSEPETDQ